MLQRRLMEFSDDQTIFNNAQRDVATTRSPRSPKYLISYYPPTDNGQIARLFTMLGEFSELFFCLRVCRVGIKLNLPYNPCPLVYVCMTWLNGDTMQFFERRSTSTFKRDVH